MTDFLFNKVEQTKINDSVEEAVSSLMKQKTIEATEKEHRKDIFEKLKDENVPIDKKLFNWLVNERFEGKSSDLVSQHEDVIALDETLRSKEDTTEE